MAKTKAEARKRRRTRIRRRMCGTQEKPRLAVFRSARHIYAQVIDDENNKVLAAASTLTKGDRDELAKLKKVERATKVGSKVAELCKSKGIAKVVFDRGGFQFHGRIKALADAARKSGLKF